MEMKTVSRPLYHDNVMGLVHSTQTIFGWVFDQLQAGELVDGDVIDLRAAMPNASADIRLAVGHVMDSYVGAAHEGTVPWRHFPYTWTLSYVPGEPDGIKITLEPIPDNYFEPVSRLVRRSVIQRVRNSIWRRLTRKRSR